MYVKKTPPRSNLTLKPKGRIFTSIGLKWIPMGKTVGTCLNSNDSAIPLGKEKYTPNAVIYANSSSLSAITKCERHEEELSKRTENVNNKSFNDLSKRVSKFEQHLINLELALQQCQEQIKNDKVWKQKESSSFRELNDNFFEIQDLKAQLQGKDIAISELKKFIEDMKLIEIILFIVDTGCSKHMTRNLKLLVNSMEKFLGTVQFGNDQFAPILGYGDLVQENVTIKRVYYVEGLNHNLFFVGQFCDADLEVDFWKSTCYVRDLKGNDLVKGSHGTDLYSITL
ncbi:hypothetical protein Tco_1569635 [Tanacetum coccineum]